MNDSPHVNPAGLTAIRLTKDWEVAVLGKLPEGTRLELGPLAAWRLIQTDYAVEEWLHGDLDLGVRDMAYYARLCEDPGFLARVMAVAPSAHTHR